VEAAAEVAEEEEEEGAPAAKTAGIKPRGTVNT